MSRGSARADSIEIVAEGALRRIKGKSSWRVVDVGRGASARSCPVTALQTWIRLGRIVHGAMFRRISSEHSGVGPNRMAIFETIG